MYRFFDEPETQSAIELLSAADKLSVFVGAGASAEVGLPTWARLIDQLGDLVVGDVDEEHRPAVKRFIADAGPLAAAERIERSLAGDLVDPLRTAIYGGNDPDLILPGPLTIAAARLKCEFTDSVALLTTNYDQLLVKALRDGGMTGASSYTTGSTRDDAVIHLHGVIGFEPPADGENEIVLTERDFLAPEHGGWRRDVVNKALRGGSCVFVGASLTDLNLLTPLHNQAPTAAASHVVVFARDPDADPAVVAKTEDIDRRRLEAIGVRALYVDNYGDVGQLIEEVRLRRRDPSNYRALPERLLEWQRETMSVLEPADAPSYRSVQEQLSGALAALLPAIQAEFELNDEIVQLGLFAYGCDEEERADHARILAVSDRIMLDPRSAESLPTNRRTKWTGVRAMIDAKAVSAEYEHFASRWKYFVAVPIIAEAPLDCCVGSVVLASTSPTSRLKQINLRLNGELTRALKQVGRDVLLPPADDSTVTPSE